jgi:chemotaxis protein histidine kinase CheA
MELCMSDIVPPEAGETTFTVDTLLKYMGNDDKALAVVGKIVRDAVTPGMEPLERAKAALDEQRFYDAGRIFHSLRGSVGTLGAKRMVAAALALEQALVEQRTAEVPALFEALQREYQAVLDQAGAWLKQRLPQ